jgi:hypothetical protein
MGGVVKLSGHVVRGNATKAGAIYADPQKDIHIKSKAEPGKQNH